MTVHQMRLIVPGLPQAAAEAACGYALAGDWAHLRDYLRARGVRSLALRREAFEAARRGHSPNLVTPGEVAAAAAGGFPDLGCMECAASIRGALEARGMHGTVLALDTGNAQGM